MAGVPSLLTIVGGWALLFVVALLLFHDQLTWRRRAVACARAVLEAQLDYRFRSALKAHSLLFKPPQDVRLEVASRALERALARAGMAGPDLKEREQVEHRLSQAAATWVRAVRRNPETAVMAVVCQAASELCGAQVLICAAVAQYNDAVQELNGWIDRPGFAPFARMLGVGVEEPFWFDGEP